MSGDWDFRAPRALGDQVLDMAYGDLIVSPDGLAHTTMTDPASGRSIDAWQERGIMHVFTADTVPRPRGSFAMESVEFMTNSYRRPDRRRHPPRTGPATQLPVRATTALDTMTACRPATPARLLESSHVVHANSTH